MGAPHNAGTRSEVFDVHHAGHSLDRRLDFRVDRELLPQRNLDFMHAGQRHDKMHRCRPAIGQP
jgi:hypothetical protein